MVELVIRPAEASDASEIASVHVAAWRVAFTFLPSRFLQGMTASVVLGKWKDDLTNSMTSMFVATQGDRVTGFVQLRIDRREGEVMSLYVDPPSWSQGVGSSLLAFGESWLEVGGVAKAVLWTATESHQSRQFYEHRGWSATGGEHLQRLGPNEIALREVEYRKHLR